MTYLEGEEFGESSAHCFLVRLSPLTRFYVYPWSGKWIKKKKMTRLMNHEWIQVQVCFCEICLGLLIFYRCFGVFG